MAAAKVVVLDYGSGNVHSAVKALAAVGADVELTADSAKVQAADGLLVPGVGAFDAVMQQLEKVDGAALIAGRLEAQKPVLGICVGQQILFETGEERGTTAPGLGLVSGEVAQLAAEHLPHMGWNTVSAPSESKLFAGIADESFYFVHSNGVSVAPVAKHPALSAFTPQITWGEHEGAKFVAALEIGPLSATQFHPEKSAAAGLKLLTNWVQTLTK